MNNNLAGANKPLSKYKNNPKITLPPQRQTATFQRQPESRRQIPPDRQGKLSTALIVSIAFFSGISAIAAGAWFSLKLILTPEQINWVDEYLPETDSIPLSNSKNPPQTFAEIQKQLQEEGLFTPALLPLNSKTAELPESELASFQLMQVMVEALQPKSLLCQSPCQQLYELRIYETVAPPNNKASKEPYFRLLSQMPVQGPAESFVLDSLTDSDSKKQGSSKSLPLTALEPLQGEAPATGIWLNFTGHRLESEKAISYGQIFHFYPEKANLSLMLQWTSPAGKLPTWQEVTGAGKPELVITRATGNEPSFQVYQIESRNFLLNPIALEEISLKQPVLENPVYRQALQLARSGLWIPAVKLMEALKQERQKKGESWPQAVQAQLDVIKLHALEIQKQFNISSTEPEERAIALLIEGRWHEALKIFEEDLENSYKIALALKADKGSLEKRLDKALKIFPKQIELKAWGALIRAAKQGSPRARQWLEEQQNNTSGTVERVRELLERMDVALSEATLINHPGKLVGLALPVEQVNNDDWLLPKKDEILQLEKGQIWYKVQVAAFHDGQNWRRAPFNQLNLPRIYPQRRLWRILGLNLDPKIQISVWMPDGQQKLVSATVKALWFDKGIVQLLASGEITPAGYSAGALKPRPIAFSVDRFRWLQPDSIILGDLNQQQPAWVMAILTNLWGDLQKARRVTERAMPNLEELLKQSSDWVVQLIDVNNNNLPDAVLTLRADVFANLQQPGAALQGNAATRTLIFDDVGDLIYSEFTTHATQSLTGFADLEDGGAVALVVDSPNGYMLKRWNAKRQIFE
ncbi:MAG: hypothetical protein N3E45_07785 [Oscillatoriaceae bacterium SKW80]|nr:hypothetical protein [Oscillatoriaceae bacterium SKYG93]MCX8120718.1 hypothetical protein [Oscillatoriaceae bacterium SKW80]MDW8453744.1 hypothetical protein [Oscillatoriaceae cyanobacterium SKYGB_i_bin93]HIK26975.1 hypothetical protein [Oscillatoriaceae cyanobacterium M7585_C2015_266]